MMGMFGYSTKGSPHYVIKQLINEGLLEKDENGKLVPKDLMSIPLLGNIRAGIPSPAHVQYGSNIRLHDLFDSITYGTSFALEVRGDSMIDAGLHEGDVVFVSKDFEARNNDIVAANVDGEWTIKYLKKQNGKVYLSPANKKYQDIYPKVSLEIGGVVVNIVRKYR